MKINKFEGGAALTYVNKSTIHGSVLGPLIMLIHDMILSFMSMKTKVNPAPLIMNYFCHRSTAFF